jgi:hypothetical protein
MDREAGRINKLITMIGQNDAEAIFRFQWESNFGWPRRGNRKCSCVTDDALIEAQCDFRQTLAQCLNETSYIGAYEYPLVSLNQANDHVSSNAGGFVYRGSELPCSLYGAYIWGDWSTKDMFTPGFPAPFNGTLQLFHTSPVPDAGSRYEENRHGKLRVGGGLLYEKNYLATWGYDLETNRIYMGVQDIIPPYYNGGEVSDRGQIYILTSPYAHQNHHHHDEEEENEQKLNWLIGLVAVALFLLLIILIVVVYYSRYGTRKYRKV